MFQLRLNFSLLSPQSVEREFHLHLAERFEVPMRLAGMVRHDGLVTRLCLGLYLRHDSLVANAPAIRCPLLFWERFRDGQRR